VTFSHWTTWLAAFMVVLAILTVGVAVQEWRELRKESRK
jgi:hypothetical protein